MGWESTKGELTQRRGNVQIRTHQDHVLRIVFYKQNPCARLPPVRCIRGNFRAQLVPQLLFPGQREEIRTLNPLPAFLFADTRPRSTKLCSTLWRNRRWRWRMLPETHPLANMLLSFAEYTPSAERMRRVQEWSHDTIMESARTFLVGVGKTHVSQELGRRGFRTVGSVGILFFLCTLPRIVVVADSTQYVEHWRG
jgi:hypothetical protein